MAPKRPLFPEFLPASPSSSSGLSGRPPVGLVGLVWGGSSPPGNGAPQGWHLPAVPSVPGLLTAAQDSGRGEPATPGQRCLAGRRVDLWAAGRTGRVVPAAGRARTRRPLRWEEDASWTLTRGPRAAGPWPRPVPAEDTAAEPARGPPERPPAPPDGFAVLPVCAGRVEGGGPLPRARGRGRPGREGPDVHRGGCRFMGGGARRGPLGAQSQASPDPQDGGQESPASGHKCRRKTGQMGRRLPW